MQSYRHACSGLWTGPDELTRSVDARICRVRCADRPTIRVRTLTCVCARAWLQWLAALRSPLVPAPQRLPRLGPYRARPVGYTTHTPAPTPATSDERESTQWPAPGTDTSAPIQTRPSNARSVEMAGKYHARGHASMWIPGSSQTNTHRAESACGAIFLVVAFSQHRRRVRAAQHTGVRMWWQWRS